MAKRYSIAAGKIIDVPEPKGPSMDIEKRLAAVESGDRIKALEDEVAMLRASNKQLMRDNEDTRAKLAKADADLAAAQQSKSSSAPAPAPVVNVPAPVVHVAPPVVNLPMQAPAEYDVRVQRDGSGRIAGMTLTPRKPLNI